MSNLKDYWTQPPQAQDMLRAGIQPTPSYLKPKGCKCKVGDARSCAVNKRLPGYLGYSDVVCPCSCHTETGGFD